MKKYTVELALLAFAVIYCVVVIPLMVKLQFIIGPLVGVYTVVSLVHMIKVKIRESTECGFIDFFFILTPASIFFSIYDLVGWIKNQRKERCQKNKTCICI